MASVGKGRLALVLTSAVFLTACEEGSEFKLFDKPLFSKKETSGTSDVPVAAGAEATTIERDVEAPEVFQQSESGLWDGRPSLGGVWVAHPDVTDPERVIIRNPSNGKFVIGALFRREREIPGPRFQISSDAATSLGLLAGSPTEISVTAMRREEVEVVTEATEPSLPAVVSIEQTSLDPVASAAQTAILAAEASKKATATPAPAIKPISKSSLKKPYIQIGIFSIEGNATSTSDMLRGAGVIPTIKKSETNGKPFWRVVVGPSSTSGDRTAVLKKVKELGFGDAYVVTH